MRANLRSFEEESLKLRNYKREMGGDTMPYHELCPMCGVIQEMDVSAFHSTKVDAYDQATTIVTVAYHCSSCGALARYEHIQEEPEEAHVA